MSDASFTPIIDAAKEAVSISERIATFDADKLSAPGTIPVVLRSQNVQVEVLTSVLDERERRLPAPSRRKGVSRHFTIESFIDAVKRFRGPNTAIFINPDVAQLSMTAIFNYHAEGPAGGRHTAVAGDAAATKMYEAIGGDVDEGLAQWGDHRAVYACKKSRQFEVWRKSNEVAMSQEAFGDHIETCLEDLVGPFTDETGKKKPGQEQIPEPAKLLEMSRDLRVRVMGKFEQKFNKTTGAYSLVNQETVEGSTDDYDYGETKIYPKFNVSVPVFQGGEAWAIEARLRMKLVQGKATFSYVLHNHDQVVEEAFDELVEDVKEQTEAPVFFGVAEMMTG